MWICPSLTFYLFTLFAVGLGCGYESCPKPKPGYLNVHLVPHSHDDIGWLKTVDQYYYGAKNFIQQASVRNLIDSTVDELLKNPDRRFIYVETGFFWRWWTNQNPDRQQAVRQLIQNGQLEFINGGWCMNDEATTHYNAIIDQMSLGLRYLNDTFGECALPRVAWQIDPFGHSREQASLFAQMGFDGLFFGRLDYQDKIHRRLTQNMETIWNGSPNNLGKDASLFTGVLFNGYNPPDGFCFDIFCGDDPIMDDPKLLGYNLDKKVRDFINVSEIWAAPYRTENVMMTMGSDFHYLQARAWYDNLDKLIANVNAQLEAINSKVNVFYSTPSCYLQAVHDANITWSTKSDDFFPYASDPNAFWTGYFTSRPTLKYYVHQTNNFLQVCKQLAAIEDASESTLEKVFKLAEPVAVTQHHDAVAGTAKQHVTDDYSLRLSIGIESCEQVISSAIMSLQYKRGRSLKNQVRMDLETFQNSVDFNPGDISFCHNLNISSCYASESMNEFILSVYNPLARYLNETNLRIPVTTPFWRVETETGEVPSEVVQIPNPVFKIPAREASSTAYYELVIPVPTFAPLALTQFRIIRQTVSPRQSPRNIVQSFSSREARRLTQGSDIQIQNSKGVSFVLDAATGFIKSVGRYNQELDKTVSIAMNQNFYYYKGMVGNNEEFLNRSSGAYIFRPNGTEPIPIASQADFIILKGDFVTEVHQTFSSWASQVIRLYDNADAIEFEWLIGPIPIDDDVGKEVITRYSSDIQSNSAFFTDSNGREILKRNRNSRDTWTYQVNEPVAGNYYPVNSRMMLSESGDLTSIDVGKTLVIMNDRAQGGTSMNDGELELMLHRRLLHDDAFGVGEALNETQYDKGLVVRGKHWLVLAGGETQVPVAIHRRLAQEIYRPPLYIFQDATTFRTEHNRRVHHRITEIGKTLGSVLPENIHLLTLEKLAASKFLLRLEHIYETEEDQTELSKPAVIPVEGLQNALKFTSIRETTLGANQWKDEAMRFDWKTTQDETTMTKSTQYEEGDENIMMIPMEIKTFIYYTN